MARCSADNIPLPPLTTESRILVNKTLIRLSRNETKDLHNTSIEGIVAEIHLMSIASSLLGDWIEVDEISSTEGK